MSNTWFTSDQHFEHENIIRLSHRPFWSSGHMTRELIRRWNDVVEIDDTVFVLGDFTLNTRAMEFVLPHLKGFKFLVPGNHDSCHSSKNQKHIDRYRAAGFQVIDEQSQFCLIDKLDNIVASVLLCHFPYSGDSQEYTERYTEFRPKDKGQILLHGHVHEAWKVRGQMINVGVDVWDYTPVSEDQIIALIQEHKLDVSSDSG